MVADGQHRDVGLVAIAEKLHVAVERGVSGVIDAQAILQVQDVPDRLTKIAQGSLTRLFLARKRERW